LTDAAKSIEQSIHNGLSITEAADNMKNAIRSELAASEGRRRVIARTEMGRAFEAAREEQMKDAGITRHEWLSSRDVGVRDSHQFVDGDVVAIGATFRNGLEYPLDPAGPPEETINCRCTTIPVLD
jgi:SPP1 gp7 family putative phage head morphogenesis protein